MSASVRAWAKAEGYDPEIHLQFFQDYLANRAKRYKDLDAAFRNCVRCDWGRIRQQATFKPAMDWTDSAILSKAQELNISTKGKSKQELIAMIRSAA